jgi:two-component SAPR family response regulator
MLTNEALIVENECIIALDLKLMLKDIGCNAKIVSRGQEAIDFIKNKNPSIALVDINLADNVTGIDVAKKMHEKNIPFIFISAFSYYDIIKRSKGLGQVEIIGKPFDKKILENKIKKSLLLN